MKNWDRLLFLSLARRRCDLKVSTGRVSQPPRLIWLIRSPSGLLSLHHIRGFELQALTRCSPFAIRLRIILAYVTSTNTTLDATTKANKEVMRSLRWKYQTASMSKCGLRSAVPEHRRSPIMTIAYALHPPINNVRIFLSYDSNVAMI